MEFVECFEERSEEVQKKCILQNWRLEIEKFSGVRIVWTMFNTHGVFNSLYLIRGIVLIKPLEQNALYRGDAQLNWSDSQ